MLVVSEGVKCQTAGQPRESVTVCLRPGPFLAVISGLRRSHLDFSVIARSAHVSATQQRDAADLLHTALTGPIEAVTRTVTDPDKRGRPEWDGVAR